MAPARVGELLARGAHLLAPEPAARLEAEVLLAYVLQAPRTRLYAAPEAVLDAADSERFLTLVDARRRGEPLAYLTGEAEFWSLALGVTRDVLVPRADTERLVEAGLEVIAAGCAATVADLGTGSGAVALAVAVERPRARVLASDRSAAALAVAAANAARHGLGNVSFLASDWLAAFGPHTLDVLLSNPPYIGAAERDGLDPELGFEPPSALFAGNAGLADLEILVRDAPGCLRSGGYLVLEHGARQGEAVRACCLAHGFTAVETLRDLAGHERVTRARRGGAA